MKKYTRPNIAFISVIIGGFVLYAIMISIQNRLLTLMFDYNTWFTRAEKEPFFRFLWFIGDSTEPHFHKTVIGGLGVLVGSIIAYILDKKNSVWAGTPICYNSGKWLWVLAASTLSLGLAVLIFGGIRLPGDDWIPTFVPYVSVAGAVIMVYGCSLPNLLTGAVFGALLTTPVSLFFREYICPMFDLPFGMASVSGMCIGGILVFELCHAVPWVKKVPSKALPISRIVPIDLRSKQPNKFFLLRMLADYSEPMFVGNEIAGAFLICGTLITWIINPMQPFYGTGWFPACLLSQILAGAISIYVYWQHWLTEDFFPSFVPLVSVPPAMILTFGPSMFVILVGAVMGGLFSPLIANMINRKIPAHWHGMIGFTFSMAFCEATTGLFIKYILMAFPFLAH